MNRFNLVLAVFLAAGLVLPIQALDTLRTELGECPEVYQDINDWEFFCMSEYIDWTLEASSSLESQGDTYGPEMMTDGLARTAWIEGRDDYGEGEFVTFTFNFTRRHQDFPESDSMMWYGFYVMNGYCKNENTWNANSRVKTLKLYYNAEPIYIIEFHDVMFLQWVAVPGLDWVRHNDSIRIEILDVYPGTKFFDTAISEFMPKTGQM
jgi:hypothetical protein